MIEPQYIYEYGPFGEAAVELLDTLCPDQYQKFIIVDPDFESHDGRADIAPQFSRGGCYIFPSLEEGADRTTISVRKIKYITKPDDLEETDLLVYGGSFLLLISPDFDIITAYSQSDWAMMAFRKPLLDEYSEWFEKIKLSGALRRIPSNSSSM